MSTQLAGQLFNLYIARIYPVLARNDPVYQRSLAKAGLGWNGPQTVPAEHKESFEQEMRMQAVLAAAKIEDARSLEPSTVRAKALAGPLTLYRVADSSRQARSESGIWWFTEKVAQRCREAAGPDPRKRLEWLRNVFAVCFNWSGFDAIERFALHAGEELPTVLGRGLPMPHYNVAPHIDRRTGERVIAIPADYWQKQGQTLLGGELQTVLPWIPVRRVSSTAGL